MKNEFWNKEEFEDLVSRSLIAMYETKLKKYKFSLKELRVTPEMIKRVRQIGCYFTATDRVVAIDENEDGVACAIQSIDILNDGRPNFAVMCHALDSEEYKNEEDSMRNGSYLEMSYMEKISCLPGRIKCDYEGKKYRLVKLWMRNEGLIEGVCEYVVIDSKGKVYGSYWIRQNHHPVTGKVTKEVVSGQTMSSQEEKTRAQDILTVDAAATIQAWQDRRYLWNVVAHEGIAKATFTVYPEEIKSLFYAREMPMTETGRKRPMLHWVAAHQRRIKNGIDVDIEKHLRGINEFVYQGTKFEITRPIKEKIK